MENKKRRALETYLKVSRSLNNMADKFESIGIKIWEGNSGESNTVKDDFTSANEELHNYCIEVMNIPENEISSFEKISLDYIFGKNDDFEGIMERMRKYWDSAE